MLGDGMLGELGGGELELEEQPARARVAPSSSIGTPRRTCLVVMVSWFMRSAPLSGREARERPAWAKSSQVKLNGRCTVHRPASSVLSTMATCG